MKTRARVPATIVQAKPRMTQPGDAAEREADQLADAALSSVAAAPLTATPLSPAVMRQERHESEYEEDDDYDLAAWARSPVTPAAPAGFLDSLRGAAGGRPLESDVRSRMERGFGQSFRDVRVHADGSAAQLSDVIDARAFTHGRDIYFGSGEYAPGTQAGDRLLAHELAHTLQQAPSGRIARSEKRREIRRAAEAQTVTWREEYTSDPAVDPAARGEWTTVLRNSLRLAGSIGDVGQRETRAGYLEAMLGLLDDDFYAWLLTTDRITVHGGIDAMWLIGDPNQTLEPEHLERLDRYRRRMRGGTDAYATFIVQQVGLAEEGLPDNEAGGGAFETAAPEDRELLEEFHSEMGGVETGELDYDEARFLAALRDLSPEDRKDFYAFARSLAEPKEGAQAQGPEAAIELFNALDPGSREALKVNREIAETEPGAPEALPESVQLELESRVTEQQAAGGKARDIATNLDRIRANALPPELAKEFTGIDFGVSLFFDETAMLAGLLTGGGQRSPLVQAAGDELLKSIVEFTQRLQTELEWLAAETAFIAVATAATEGGAAIALAPRIATLAERLRAAKRLIDTLRAAYDLATRVTTLVDAIASLREAYPAFLDWYGTATAEFAQLQRRLEAFDPEEDLEAALEQQEEQLMERLDEQLDGQLGQVLELLYIPEDTPPDELRQILFDIPRGLTALEDMWTFYRDASQQEKPQFADVLAVRAFRAGRYLYPFVGLVSALVSTQLQAAFPQRSFEDRVNQMIAKAAAVPGRRQRTRDLFGRLNRKRYEIKPGDLEQPLQEAHTALGKAISAREPSGHWAPAWFKRVLRREIKTVNRTFASRKVPATRKPDKKQKTGPPPGPEMVPLPPFRIRLKRPSRTDTRLRAELSINPKKPVDVDRLNASDFAAPGIGFTADEDRKEAIFKFLRDGNYDITPAPGGGDHIRLRGGEVGSAKRPYLKIEDNRIRIGLDKDDWVPFRNRVIGDEHDLPEGYHLVQQDTGVNVARKTGLREQGYAQLGLGEGRKLVEGAGKAAPQTVAPLTLKPPQMEPYDHAAAVASMFAKPQPGVSPFKAQRDRAQWTALMASQADLRRRPKTIEGRLGYMIRARALGSALGGRHVPELREEDDKGHLVARRFGSEASDPYWNLVPMLRRENQFPGRWYALESDMAEFYVGKTATPGDYVEFGLTLTYDTLKTRRPNKFIAKYQVFDAKGTAKAGGEKKKTVEND